MPIVVAFKGECLHDNINGMVDELGRALTDRGYTFATIDLRDRDHAARLRGVLESGDVAFALSFAGFGLDRRITDNVYESGGIRLVSIYLDPVLLYWDQIDLPLFNRYIFSTCSHDEALCDRHLGSARRVAFLPHSAPELPVRPWTARDLGIVFAGSLAGDPGQIRADWSRHGIAVEGLLNDMRDAHLAAPLRPLTDVIGECAKVQGVFLDTPQRLQPYFAALDTYFRAYARWQGVAALGDLPLTLVGSGWEKLGTGLRGATLRGPLPIADTLTLIGRAKIALNLATPYHGSHERLFYALSAGTAAVTLDSPYVRDLLRSGGLMTVTAYGAGVREAIERLMQDDAATENLAMRGAEVFRRGETWSHRAYAVLARLAS